MRYPSPSTAACRASGPNPGYTREHAITLDLGNLSTAKRIILFLHGWLTPFDSSINVAVSQRGDLPFQFPSLQVIGEDGRWQTIFENIGVPAGKDKTVVVDLTGKFPTRDFRVRITTTMQISWDEIFFSTDDEAPVRVTSLAPITADLHVISTEGWIKEGETNGALAHTVEPLVFHGMSRYPYGPEEHYPDDPVHREFLRTYNTRLVTGEAFREFVKRYIPSP